MNLKTFLEARDLSGAAFARLIEVAPSCISNYLVGERRPSLQVAMKIKKATKGLVTFEDLMDYYEKNKKRKSK